MEEKRKLSGFVTKIRNTIVSGIVIVIPIGLTMWFGKFVYSYLSEWAIDLIKKNNPTLLEQGTWVEFSVRSGSILLILVSLILIGILARYTVGKKLLSIADSIMRNLPMLSTIYSTTRQIRDAIWSTKSGVFDKVVLFEYPRRGIWVTGFLTNENDDESWELHRKTGADLISVFLPTTPNPTSGFLLFIPRKDCIYLDMAVADGMRLVISGGAVTKDKGIGQHITTLREA